MDVVDLDFIEVVLDTYLLCMHEVPAFVELIMNYLKPVLAQEAKIVSRDSCRLLAVVRDHLICVTGDIRLSIAYKMIRIFLLLTFLF